MGNASIQTAPKPPAPRSATRRALPEMPPPEALPQHVHVAGNELTVFVESPPLFDAMIRDIHAAKARVWVETYIFYNDAGGTRIANALKDAARRGVDVRVLYDAVGSNTTPASFFADMHAAGIQVHAFHSFLESVRAFRPLTILNRRDHRKLLIVDDTAGYFGGMNLIDNVETVQQLKEQDRPKSSGWRDVHLRLAGPQQAELAESFERIWNRVHGMPVPKRSRRAMREHFRSMTNGQIERDEMIRFFDSGPRNKFSRAARVYTRLIKSARRQITLSMAYFIPVGGPLRALLAARRKRVAIRIIVPGDSDVPLVKFATTYLYDKLLRRGMRIYERQHRMLHSKVLVVDNLYTVLGSANLDPRSFYTNLEFLAVVRSKPLADIMLRICRYEASQSQRITMTFCRQMTQWKRFLYSLAWGLRWWL